MHFCNRNNILFIPQINSCSLEQDLSRFMLTSVHNFNMQFLLVFISSKVDQLQEESFRSLVWNTWDADHSPEMWKICIQLPSPNQVIQDIKIPALLNAAITELLGIMRRTYQSLYAGCVNVCIKLSLVVSFEHQPRFPRRTGKGQVQAENPNRFQALGCYKPNNTDLRLVSTIST